MNHYETLGVAKDASPDEIKQAWRRAASKAHPDRADDEVLSDPERRARFDAGENLDEKPLEVEARDMLIGALAQGIDGAQVSDPIAAAQGMLDALQSGLTQHASAARSTIKRLEKLSGRIKAKMGENLAQGMIQQRLDGARKQLQTIERGQKVHALAAAMLLNYSFETPPTPTQTSVYAGGSGAFDPIPGLGFWR